MEPTNRSFSVIIEEQIRYSKVYDETALADLMDVSREFLAARSDAEVCDLIDADGAVEEDLQRHGDVQASAWRIERDRSAEIPANVKPPVDPVQWDF